LLSRSAQELRSIGRTAQWCESGISQSITVSGHTDHTRRDDPVVDATIGGTRWSQMSHQLDARSLPPRPIHGMFLVISDTACAYALHTQNSDCMLRTSKCNRSKATLAPMQLPHCRRAEVC
jgi:hypothetical protein